MAVGAILGKSANSGGGSGSGGSLGISQALDGYLNTGIIKKEGAYPKIITNVSNGHSTSSGSNTQYCFLLKDFFVVAEYYYYQSANKSSWLFDRHTGKLLKTGVVPIEDLPTCYFWIYENMLIEIGAKEAEQNIRLYSFTNDSPYNVNETIVSPTNFNIDSGVANLGTNYFVINNEKIVKFDLSTKKIIVLSQTPSNLGFGTNNKFSMIPFDENRLAIFGLDYDGKERRILWNPVTGIIEDVTETKKGLKNMFNYALFSTSTTSKSKEGINPYFFTDGLLVIVKIGSSTVDLSNCNVFVVYDHNKDETRVCAHPTHKESNHGMRYSLFRVSDGIFSLPAIGTGISYDPVKTNKYFCLETDFNKMYKFGITLPQDFGMNINENEICFRTVSVLAKTKIKIESNLLGSIYVKFNRFNDYEEFNLLIDDLGYYEMPYDGYLSVWSLTPFISPESVVFITK